KNWAFISGALQVLPVEAKLDVTYRRNNELKTVSLESMESKDGFLEARGLNFNVLEKTRTAQNFSEAIGLGFQETGDKLVEVGRTLKRLVTGGIPVSNLGGPLSIFTVARREATEGWARLLIFLTFLSANLALLNFLPIPVLDGGHMVFLIAEGLRGKPIDENTQGWALMVGMVFLLSLMVFVFGNDIFKLFLMSTAFWL
ncbi:MAG TPA: site-2 protease family protein, partial [Pirellulaceae bacterium]|nr:site-2 protease family protein [Pirellulaceae bacterium]